MTKRMTSNIVAIAALFMATTIARAAAAADAPVTLDASKPDVAILDNGIVRVTLDTANAEITSIRYGEHEMVSVGRHAHVYFSRDGGTDYERFGHCVGSVASQSADGVDYSCKHVYDAKKDRHAWDVDLHFVVRRGVPGVYIYQIASHPASYPELGIGEFRMVWSTPEGKDELGQIYVDQTRHWPVPAMADFAKAIAVPGAPKEVTELTTGAWKGRYDCKYMYSAIYDEIGTWGFASDQKHAGAFVVLPSCEWFNDGPNKQDLDAAVGTTLVHLNRNHYDGTGMRFAQGEAWRKFYGPFLLYVNDKQTGDACWHDAQARVKTEQAAWPYAWVNNPDYPNAAGRSTVRGTFRLADALKPKLTADGAWIGLAKASTGERDDFQSQADGYQFWSHVKPDGSFEIPAVRPGDYALYAYANGATGEFEQKGIHVDGNGKTKDLGSITWNVPHAGKSLAWEIGTPDRRSTEFAHGTDFWTPMLFTKLWTEVPNPLDFTVGKSDPSKDWYYAQTRHQTGPEKFEAATWRVHFSLKAAPSGDATLTLAFAGADRARLSVAANDGKAIDATPTIQGGNALIRESDHAKYCVSHVTIPAGELHAGDNTIALTQESSREASAHVMWDYLSLELP